MKKFLALLMAALLICSLGSVAFADTSTGKITVKNTVPGETYNLYKVFDLTYADPVTKDTDGMVSSPVSYTFTKTDANTGLYNALVGDDDNPSPFTLTESTTAGLYNVSLKDETTTGAAIADFLSGLVASKVLTIKETETASVNGDVEFTNVGYGYFYIDTSNGTAVTVDSTIPDVTVVDKNTNTPTWDNEPENPGEGEDPNPGKVIVNADGSKTTVNSANYGDTVNFNISVNATAWVKGSDAEDFTEDANSVKLATYYYITDTLDDGFTLNSDSIKVRVYELGEDGNYKTTYTELTDVVTVDAENANKFDITIPWGELYGSKAKIEVTYSATVNADGTDVVIGGDGNHNTANFTYSTRDTDPDDPEDPTVPEDPNYPDPDDKPGYKEENKKTTTTYVYALAIQKVDEKGNALAGAKFSIANVQGTGSAGEYEYCALVLDCKNENLETHEHTADCYKLPEGATKEFETDASGLLVIKGVAEGTYAVTETVAPNGYNKLTTPVNIAATFAEKYTETTIATYYYDSNGNLLEPKDDGSAPEGADSTKTKNYTSKDELPVYGIAIENKSGIELPSTGGAGTTAFIIGGAVLFMLTMILLVTKKRVYNAG